MESARFVGAIPQNYDRDLGPHIFDGFADDLAMRVARRRPESVLELAAGTGIVSRKLKDRLPECRLTASDLNEPMLEIAKTKFGAGDDVKFEQIDAMHIPYPDDTFDVLMCQFGVMFFPDKIDSYREALRVLTPHGTYVFNVWGPWVANPFGQITHETVAAFFPDDPPGFYRVPFHYHDAGHIKSDLLNAGFAQVELAEVALKSQIASVDKFANGLVFGNPLYQEIVSRGGDPDEICAAVAAAIDRQLGSELSLQALVVSAFAG